MKHDSSSTLNEVDVKLPRLANMASVPEVPSNDYYKSIFRGTKVQNFDNTSNSKKYISQGKPAIYSSLLQVQVNVMRRKGCIYPWVPMDQIVNANTSNGK